MGLRVGQEFASYAAFEIALRKYENESFANFAVSSSVPLKRTNQITNLEVENFKYQRIYLVCKLSGTHTNRSENIVRNASTYKQGCESLITVVLKKSANRRFLQVTKLNGEHNHMRNEALYQSMPKQRREVVQNASELLARALKTRPNYQLLQREISLGGPKKGSCKRKDLYNANAKNKSFTGSNDLEKLVNDLLKVNGAVVKIVRNTENELEGVFFQDEHMKQYFDAYPEILMFDGTYSLNDRRMPLIILLIVDGNGESQIAGLFLVRSENLAILSTMFREFKNENEKWDKIEVVITDKAITNLQVVEEHFPQAVHQLCIFHTKQIFLREITTQKRKITHQQRADCLAILNGMVFAKSQADYDAQYVKLQNTRCPGMF